MSMHNCLKVQGNLAMPTAIVVTFVPGTPKRTGYVNVVQ